MFKKVSITFLTSILGLIANIISGIVTARFLGPGGKGELTAITLWPIFIAAVGCLGIAESTVFLSGKEDEKSIPSILTTGVIIALIQSALLIIIGLLLIPVLMKSYSNQSITLAKLFLCFIPINLIALNQHAVIQGRLKIIVYNLARLILSWSYTILIIILFLFKHLSVQNCVISLLVSYFLNFLFVSVYSIKQGWYSHIFDWSILRKMLNYGIKAHIGNVSSILNLRLDQMVMAVWLPPKLLGLYVVAVTFSSGLNLISSAIATIGFPSLSMTPDINDQSVKISRLLRLNFWACGMGAIVMIVISPYLLPLLFGSAYASSVQVAQVLIMAAFFSGANSVLASSVKGTGRPIISTYSELIGLLVTVIILYLLLPRMLIMGAAIASLVAYFISFTYLLMFIRKYYDLPLRQLFFPQSEDRVWLHETINQIHRKYI